MMVLIPALQDALLREERAALPARAFAAIEVLMRQADERVVLFGSDRVLAFRGWARWDFVAGLFCRAGNAFHCKQG